MKKQSFAETAREITAASDSLLKCCCPITRADEFSRPEFFGSGTLICIGPQHIVITAAHVLDEADTSALYVQCEKERVEIRGPGSITTAPACGGRDADSNDLAYIAISQDDAERIKSSFSFLPIQLVDNSDSIHAGKVYRFSGYPCSMQTVDHNAKSMAQQRYIFTAEPTTEVNFGKLGLNDTIHIVVRFPKDKVRTMDGNRAHSPPPHGMSGGAVFGIARGQLTSGEILHRVCLVGIGIQIKNEDRLLVGVRLTGVLERIRSDFPKLSTMIPESTTIEIVLRSRSA